MAKGNMAIARSVKFFVIELNQQKLRFTWLRTNTYLSIFIHNELFKNDQWMEEKQIRNDNHVRN